jgi:hypothetical protein
MEASTAKTEEAQSRLTCGVCGHAAQHPFKPASKVICMEGYGVRGKTWFACRAFAGPLLQESEAS